MRTFESFIGNFDGKAWSDDIYDKLISAIRDDRAALPEIAHWILATPGRHFNLLADLIPHLTEAEFAALAEDAVQRLANDEDSDDVRKCIERASLQIPQALRPHLALLGEQDDLYRSAFAWRASDQGGADALAATVAEECEQADCERLMETGNAAAIRRAYERLSPDGRADLAYWALMHDVELVDGEARPLTLGRCHHLQFDTERPSYAKWLDELRSLHPTLRLRSAEDVTGLAGGKTEAPCGLCGGEVAVFLRLREAPPGFAVSARPLTLAVCVACLTDYAGGPIVPLFYDHRSGEPVTLNPTGQQRTPEIRWLPMPVSRMRASPTPPRWEVQDDGLANSRENLHRLGGRPTWVQEADYPNCPTCTRRMPFLAQLSCELPVGPGADSGLNEDGLTYFFWCDACQLSAVTEQYT
jgi:hypothetical protein